MVETTWGGDDGAAGEVDAGHVLVGRYTLVHKLGEGGFGAVWRAHDGLAKTDVALKLVPGLSAADRAAVAREAAALRFARLPGVVSLIDDGVEGDTGFLVMPWVRGAQPFPGRAGPMSWDQLREVVLSLLEILSRVHHAGIVHQDLKPSNVLVDGAGRVHVLDFGAATGRALRWSERGAGFVGTPLYAAPEVRHLSPPSVCSDIWSTGAMVYEALTGQPPHADASLQDLFVQQALPPLPHLSTVCPDVPADVADAVMAMLAWDPEVRLHDAPAVLAALGNEAHGLVGSVFDGPDESRWTRAALRACFHGPDLFLHLAQDAVEALWARTGGDPARVRREGDAWVRAGLARVVDGRLEMDRTDIAALLRGFRVRVDRPDTPADLSAGARDLLALTRLVWPLARPAMGAALGATDEDLQELLRRGLVWPLADGSWGTDVVVDPLREFPGVQEAALKRAASAGLRDASTLDLRMLFDSTFDGVPDAAVVSRQADGLVAAGRVDEAISLLELGVLRARDAGYAPTEEALVQRYVMAVLSDEGPGPIDRALRVLDTGQAMPGTAAWLALLRARLEVARGEGARAVSRMRAVAAMPTVEGEVKRRAVLCRAALVTSPEAAERIAEEALEVTGGRGEVEAERLGWLGMIRYRQARYTDAAALHRRAGAMRTTDRGRMSCLINEGAAWLEAGELALARQVAEHAGDMARSARHGQMEAWAAWIARSAAYRADDAHEASEERLDAALHLGSYTGAMHGAVESAIAWRSGDVVLARRLVMRTIPAGLEGGQRGLALLAAGLGAVLGLDLADAVDLSTLEGVPPLMAVQVIGLLARAGMASDARRADGLTRCRLIDAPHDHRRLEVISPAEAWGWLTERRA